MRTGWRCRPSRISPSSAFIANPSAPWHFFLHGVFPMPAIEMLDRELADIDIVEAAHIDVDLVRVGARHIERMHAAMLAEGVLRHAGVERVGGEIGLAR